MAARKMLTKPQRAMFEKELPKALAEHRLALAPTQTVDSVIEDIRAQIVAGIIEPTITFEEWFAFISKPAVMVVAGPEPTPVDVLGVPVGEEVPQVSAMTVGLDAIADSIPDAQAIAEMAPAAVPAPLVEPAPAEKVPVTAELGGLAVWMEPLIIAKEKIKKLEVIKETCQKKITDFLEESGADTAVVDGKPVASWTPVEKKVFNSKAWKESHPGEVEEYTNVSKFYRFDLK